MHRSRIIEWATGCAIVLTFLDAGVLVYFGSPEWAKVVLLLAGIIAGVGLAGAGADQITTVRSEWLSGTYDSRTVCYQESTFIRFPPDAVWAALEPPEFGPMLQEDIRSGRRVPGTPIQQVGEQQAYELLDGSTLILEVTAIQPGCSTTVVQISPPSLLQTRYQFAVDAAPGGTLYTSTVEVDVPKGRRLRRRFESSWRNKTRIHMRLLSSLVADSAPKGTVAGTDPGLPDRHRS